MVKRKGSVLIENIFAMAVIVIVIFSICEVTVSRSKWMVIKSKKDEFLRISYCIEQELKYNLTIEEIKNMCKGNIVSLNKDNILKQLTSKSLLSIEHGNDITITINDISEDRVKIDICLKEEYYGNTVESERSFIKDSVMNEYYK